MKTPTRYQYSHLMLRQQLEHRLQTLKAELASGEQILIDLETQLAQLTTKRTRVRDTMLRLTGAIQVLESELAQIPEPSEVLN